MNKKLKAAWVRALRSGKYKQTTGGLQNDDKYCCLGVLCRVAEKRGAKLELEDGWVIGTNLNDQPSLSLELQPEEQNALISMNDEEGRRFKTIANWIEKNVEATP